MIDIIKINTIEELSTLLYAQEKDKRIGRFRSSYLFRGLPNESYSLVTSLKRNCKAKQHELEKSILRNFTKYAVIEDSYRSASRITDQIVRLVLFADDGVAFCDKWRRPRKHGEQ